LSHRGARGSFLNLHLQPVTRVNEGVGAPVAGSARPLARTLSDDEIANAVSDGRTQLMLIVLNERAPELVETRTAATFPGRPRLQLPCFSPARAVSYAHEVVLSVKVPNELRWLVKQIRPFVPWHIASFLSMTAASMLALLTPLVLKWLIDQILPRRETHLLVGAAALIFLSYEGRTLLASLGSYLTLTAAQKMSLQLRMDLLRHLDQLSADYYENTPSGAVMYPLKEPIEEVAYFGSDLLPSILHMCLTIGFTLVTMFVLSPVLTLVILPLIPMFLVARQHFRTKLSADSDAVQQNLIAWNAFLEEHISSVLSIQLLGRDKQQERKAFCLMARTTRSHLALFKTGGWFTVWTSLAVVCAMSAVIGYGGWGVLAGTLSLGSLMAFYSFVTQLFDPLSGAAELYARAQKTFAGIRQLQAVFALCPSISESQVPVEFPNDQWGLEFKAVEFGYGQENALIVPSLRIAAGERIAIIGENGAGKSTLARLIPRLYDVRSGSICLDGIDIRKAQLKRLRAAICYLPRDPVLFDGTLASNLRFVRPDVSDRELLATLHLADLGDMVAKLPEGIYQRIGPDGCQLSGGQRQRLAIARAFLQRPKIVILDEATSCLDPSSEAHILGNLLSHLSTTTLIVISHRASTVAEFGRVLSVSRGKIVQDSASALISNADNPSNCKKRSFSC
jgi:ABC-type bacteriocin/lantibiotic exporter with double-glycine peptidase domain